MELSFNLVKPDGISRGLIGRIFSRFEEKGLKLVACKFVQASPELIKTSYADNAEEAWFPDLVDYLTSGPVIAMVWAGENANDAARQVIGQKNPMKSDSGSLRGKYNISMVRTIVHGSRTPEEAKREIGIWFGGEGPKPEWELMDPAAMKLLGGEETNDFPKSIEVPGLEKKDGG